MKENQKFILSIIGAFFVGIIGTICTLNLLPNKEVAPENKEIKSVSIIEQDTIKSAIDKVYDAVVYIENFKGNTRQGSGTGFVYKKDLNKGYIITNHHVIDGATSIKVLNINGEEVDATLLGSDEIIDIAILSIDLEHVLQVAELGASQEHSIGDTVFTVGSPLGIDYIGTVTKGILSGKDRTIEVASANGSFVMEVLQTDAAINPGNSGGPLVDINGQVIGVNSLKLVQNEIEGMGFAIPIEVVNSIIDKLAKGEKIVRPMLGVEMANTTDKMILAQNNIRLDASITSGVVIVNVIKDSPADVAGLKSQDVIIKINSTKVDNMAYFRHMLYKHNVGDEMKVTVIRNGKEKEITVKLTKSL